ncbi:LysE family transporter [Streptomyces sp. So13.3]|uniref:LysE family translocator n=1 Tax=Streptomyces TaxID=1883 RepID=UPI00164E5A30|nr:MULTISPECIES: LysE family transporter [Streptomyces]QNA71331.1 LysE family transporter [Streptomyces sp. So13.3]
MRELALGIALGFSAGISPGPLLALVLTGTLRGGLGIGLRVAAVPLLTDLPVIVSAVTVLAMLPDAAISMGGVVGGFFLLYLALSTLREARTAQLPSRDGSDAGDQAKRALWQGALANLLSPHPWMFWLTTGAPLLVAAWRHGSLEAGSFLFGFYLLLVGSKASLALVIARARHRIGTRGFRWTLAGSGVLLMAASGLLLAEFGPGLVATLRTTATS